MGVVLCCIAALANVAAAAADPIGMICTCTKVSDSELRIDCVTDFFENLYYYYVYSDGSIEPIAPENNIIDHTFTGVSLSSFPLEVSVYVYADEWGTQLQYQRDEPITCCELFAPEIDLSEGGSTIADGATHDVGGNPVGNDSLVFVVDNTAGAGPLTVSSVAATGLTNCSDFAVDTTLPLIVAEGAASTLRVSFAIDRPGAFAFDLTVVNNDLDEDPYDVHISGNGLTPLQATQAENALQVIPNGAGGQGAFLDRFAPVDEAGEPLLLGSCSLSGIYEVGETISGAALICDPSFEPQCTLWLHLFLYAVDLDTRPETLTLVTHWVEHFDREQGTYVFDLDTTGVAEGIYDLYISIPGGPGEVLRIQLISATN